MTSNYWKQPPQTGENLNLPGLKFHYYKNSLLPIFLNAFPISGSTFQIHESCFQLMAVNNRSQSSLIFMAVLPNFGTQIHHNPEIHGLDFQFF